jgi:hypothetical protein
VGLRVGLDVVVMKEESIALWNRIPVLLSLSSYPGLNFCAIFHSYLKEHLLTSRNMQSDNHLSNLMFLSQFFECRLTRDLTNIYIPFLPQK